jgi:Leucine-rich repeat (LRR) protein
MNVTKSAFLLLLFLISSSLFSQTRATDSLALVAIYNAFDGANWNNNTNWLDSGQTIDSWDGVTVTADRVTILNLSSRNLQGEFPVELGNLTDLEYLYLNNNQGINDTIPSEIGNLTKLITLQLNNSDLVGQIPDELYKLDTLATLYLYNNNLEGAISDSVYKLKELSTFRIFSNNFTSISNRIGRLSKLNDLSVQSNQLTSLPDSINNLTNLTTLEASNNFLTTIPVMGGMTNLGSLTLDNNSITNITGKLTGSNLYSLFISGNTSLNLSALADEVKTLINLGTLNASNCSFNEAIPDDLFDTPNLLNLYMTNSGITGQIPTAVQNASSLISLQLDGNQLTGSIPLELTRIKTLQGLYLHSNKLNGSIPDSISQLENLDTFYLSNNEFSGSIPQTIGRLKKLSNFRAENNKLSGVLTDSLINCVQLYYLFLSNNNITGAFPDTLLQHPYLSSVYLEYNEFDALPDFTGTNLANKTNRFRYNKLGFSSIVPNITGITNQFLYNPQSKLGADSIISVIIGDTVTLLSSDMHIDNSYQWLKNGANIAGATDSAYQVIVNSSTDLASYTYQITNSNVAGMTISSSKFNVVSPDLIAPNAPTGISVTNLNGGATITWNANTELDFDKYYLYVDTLPNPTTLSDSTNQTNVSPTGLTNGQSYYLRLKAKDVWGNLSGFSSEATVVPDGVAPVMVQNLQAVAGEGLVSLTWDQNPESDIQNYRVYRSTNINDTSFYNQTSASSLVVYSLTNNLQYYFWVRAQDYAGNMGPYTAALTETPMDFAPTKPTNFSAVGVNNSAYLSWNTHNQADVRAYYIYQDNTPNATTLVDSVIGRTNIVDTITGLVGGNTYYFRMRALDNGGKFSDYTDESGLVAGKNLMTDSLALVAIYNAIGGASWSNSTNWLVGGQPVNTWAGVSVSSDRVSSLNLNYINASGVLPSEIGELDALTSLSIRGNNNIIDTIPKSIGNLINLTALNLYNNSLSGTIPSTMANLQNLVLLDLRYNELAGEVSSSIGDLTNLNNLYLTGNDFTSVSSNIGNLSNLNNAYFDGNKLTSLPTSIGNLSSLTVLQLNNNQLTNLPTEIGNLALLVNLNINGNILTSLPSSLSGLNNLQILSIGSNSFSGIPSVVFDISSLNYLEIGSLSLSTFPTSLNQLTNLKTILADNNQLTGVPGVVFTMTGLTNLELNNNSIASFPDSVLMLSNIQTLRLDNNQITGEIPTTISNLSKLQTLYLNNNQFTGSIPASFGNITTLSNLFLQNNQLTGVVPENIKNSSTIYQFNIEYNQITDLPNFTGANIDASLGFLQVRGNKLGFDDIIPNIGVPQYNYQYNAQGKIGEVIDTILSSGDNITLNASASNHIDDNYQWYKNNVAINGQSSNSLVLNNVTEDSTGTFHYRVTNAGAAGTLISEDIFVRIPDSLAPPVPVGLSASPRNASVFLTWNNTSATDLKHYKIYQGLSAGSLNLVDSVSISQATITGLANGTQYFFQITAEDVFGNISTGSAIVNATPDGTAPAAPDSLQAFGEDGQIRLTWKASVDGDVDNYRIYRGLTANPTTYLTNTSALTYTDGGPSNGQTYHYRVTAQDIAINEGTFSNNASATATDLPPSTPSNLTASAGNEKVYLDWNNNPESDVRAYYVYQSNSANATTLVDSVIGRTNSLITISGLTNSTNYFFRLKAIDQTGFMSGYSNEVQAVPGQYRMADSLALVALYNATGGASWNNSTNWLDSGQTINTWNGVTVVGERVTQINLYNRNLNGTLPSEIGNLTGLTSLTISQNNNLVGSIPSTVGNLTNLTTLSFYNNSMTGSIPSDLGTLVNLVTLDLRNNAFTGQLPDEIASLDNLANFYLSSNQLSGTLNSNIGGMASLVNLYLDNNNLTALPASIGSISTLTTLYLHNNSLNSLPAEIGNLSNLYNLYVYGNNLSSLPTEIGNLNSLYRLEAYSNKLTSIPSTIGNLSSLNRLNIQSNLLSSLPNELNNLSNLQYLYLQSNTISTLPAVLSGLTNLNTLQISNNQFSVFPSGIITIPNLQILEMYNNQMTSIPASFGNMASLISLRLDNNPLGGIPSSIYQLTGLTTLYMPNCQITSISDSLYDLVNIVTLQLYNNQISSALSESISNMTNLQNINIENNQFYGSIPAALGDMTNLRYLYLRNNQFSGALPENIKNSSTIDQFYLTNNNISSLPDFTGTNIDASLRYFYVENNELTFKSLIPNVGVPQIQYRYNPQKQVGTAVDTTLTSGDSITFRTFANGHIDNAYQWYKGNSQLVGQTSDSLRLNNVTLDSIGTFTYRITNPGLSMTLTSKDLVVRVPDSIAPGTPANFRAYPRNESIYFTWNAVNVPDLKHYLISYGTTDSTLTMLDSATTTNTTIANLTNGTTYYFNIRAMDLWDNESNPSATISSSPDGTPPAIPDSLKASPSDSRIVLTWNAVADADLANYRIYKGTSPSPTTYYTNTTALSYTDNNTANTVTYYYRLTTMDQAGNESAYSAEASATPVNTSPPATTVISAVASNEQVYIRWQSTTINDFNYYELFLDDHAFADSLYGNTTSNSITITGLTNGQTYHFRLKVVDDTDLRSDFSNELSFVPGNYLQTDSLALVALYDSLAGDNWNNKTNWKSTEPISNWYGVSVNNNRVTNLNLRSNNLVGEIPADIGDLTGLDYLELRNNKLTGSIPSEIGNLVNLQTLRLYSNQLTGSIPASLGNLKALIYLYLYSNQLTGAIPAELGNMTSLQYFNAYSNQLNGSIPGSLGNLDNLRELSLQNNQLSGSIPDGLSNFKMITTINLQNNNLTGSIPASLGQLSTLTQLYLNNNNLSGSLPSELSNLKSLSYFYANNNQITGSLPASYGSMTALYRLYLYSNQISGSFPVEMANLNNLDRINITDNNITEIPDFGSTQFTKRLYITNNRLSFEDIIPNVDNFTSTFSYNPQQNTGTADTLWVNPGVNINFSASLANRDGVAFQWRKNNGTISGATDSTYSLTNITSNDFGYYDAVMTHSALTSLTLYRHRVYVQLLKKPDMTVSVAQNLIASKEAELFVISDIDLKDGQPEIWISSGAKNDKVAATAITDKKVFRASYEFDGAGRYDILINAKGASGLDTTIQRSFTASLVRSKVLNIVESFDKAISLKINPDFFSKDRMILTEKYREKGNDFYQVGGLQKGNSEAELSLGINKEAEQDLSKLFIYHYDGSKWNRLETKIFASAGTALAKVNTLGKFKLAVDPNFKGSNLIPEKFDLLNNYPNPFNPVTTIPFQLKENTKVEIAIYNVLGQKIKTLISRTMEAGSHKINWDSRNDFGAKVASGIYFYRLVTPKFTKAQKMILIK